MRPSQPVPPVTAVCLVDGRLAMVERAMRSFAAQTYPNRCLLLYDTGELALRGVWPDMLIPTGAVYVRTVRPAGAKLGDLRNLANEAATGEILLHWDSDDWSHPLRIEEQVFDLIAAECADATGYNDLLAWNSGDPRHEPGAWLYQGRPNYMVGTSLCYWRQTWRNKPFPSLNSGEDHRWCSGLNGEATTSLRSVGAVIIAEVHGHNTHLHLSPGWTRAGEWDEYCSARMEGGQ